MRLCVFYDADGPNGAQFALNPDEVQSVEGCDGEDGSESVDGQDRTIIILRNGTRRYACETFPYVVRVLEGRDDNIDSRLWDEDQP